MASYDLKGMSEEFFGHVMLSASSILPKIGWGEVAVGVFLLSTVLYIRLLYLDWKAKKGYRMAVRERTTKETELLTEIINDALFDAVHKGKLSQKRYDALLQMCSDKLHLPDLVPKQRRLKTVKEDIKKRLFAGKQKGDTSKWRAYHKTEFSESIGRFANKFWKKAA